MRATSTNTRYTFNKPALAGAASVLLLAMPVHAQDTGASPVIEEVVVTAQKRVENVQEVPKAIEVLNETALTRAGINNLQDLSRISPSVQGTPNSGSPPAIRGISSFAYSIGVQAQTGVVLDDIPQPNFSTLADELSDVSRVEILPGPQSTLSGRNAAGGLINIVTRAPSAELAASFTGEVTDDEQKRVAGYVTGPLSDQWGFSVSGFSNDWDGPLRNIATDHRLGGYDRRGIRGKLRFAPTDAFSATLTAYYTRNEAPTQGTVAGYPYVVLTDNAQSFFAPVPLRSLLGVDAGPGNRDINSAYEGDLDSRDKGATLHLDYDASFASFSSITSYSKSKTDTTTPLASFSFFPEILIDQSYDVDNKTQELRMASPQNAGNLEYLVGLIYSDMKIVEPYARPVIFPVDWDRTAIIRSTALYGRGTYAVLPETFVTAGLRVQHDLQKYDWVFNDGLAPESNGTNKYDFVAGELSVRQVIGTDTSVYATYANAQTGEAYDLEDSPSATTPAGLSPLNSEKVQSYEVGIKSQLFDRRLTLNASVFDQRYRNYQIQRGFLPDDNSLPSIRLFAIGKVESRGLELESSYAATPDLQLSAALTFLDAKIRDYPDALCYTGQLLPSCTGRASTQGNLAGTRMPGSSKFKGMASVAYTLPLPSVPFDGTFNAFYRYQSATHFDVLNDPASHIGGYGVVNLAAGIQSDDGHYTLQLFVNNLFDKLNYAALARDTIVFDPTGGNPAAVYGTYGRDWHRYAGLRVKIDY